MRYNFRYWKGLVVMAALGCFCACSDDDVKTESGLDGDFTSSLLSANQGVDFSMALKQLESSTTITAKVKEVRNYYTQQVESLFLDSCEVIGWSAPVDPATDNTMEKVLAKYKPSRQQTLSVNDTALVLYGAGSAKIPAGIYVVDMEFSDQGKTWEEKEACLLQLKDNSARANGVAATVMWGISDKEKTTADVSGKELTDEDLKDFTATLEKAGKVYNPNYGYLVLKIKDRRNQPVSWLDRLQERSGKSNFALANPWAADEIVYTHDAIIIPYPVPTYPIVTQNSGTTMQYKIDKQYLATRQDIYLDCNVAVKRKGVFEISTKLTDDDVQGKVTVLPSGKKIYLPREDVSNGESLREMDLYNDESQFSYHRMASSEDFVIFWEKKFGDDPNSTALEANARVNVDDLLEKGEEYFRYYRDSMKFVEVGKSHTDSIRMLVYLYYSNGNDGIWIANGGGSDNVIGSLWVSSNAVRPVGQTFAHEFGHSFQYQVYCDDPARQAGFRQAQSGVPADPAGDKGNGFWETTANYQAFQHIGSYPEWTCNIDVYVANCYKGFMHEWYRYQSYYLMEYWRQLHGLEIAGRVWRESLASEDPITTYKRITGTDQDKFNQEVWESACRDILWDYAPNGHTLRASLDKYVSEPNRSDRWRHRTRLIKEAENIYRSYPDTTTVDHAERLIVAFSPHDYGYNAIQLTVPEGGTEVTVDFEGLPNAEGYRIVEGNARAGWCFGFVGVQDGNVPVYGQMAKATKVAPTGEMTFRVPAGGLKELWLVVSGAPTEHKAHRWDDDASNDEQYPYRIKLTNASVVRDYEE